MRWRLTSSAVAGALSILAACGSRSGLTLGSGGAADGPDGSTPDGSILDARRDRAADAPPAKRCTVAEAATSSVLVGGDLQPAAIAVLPEGVVFGEWHFNASVGLVPFAGGSFSLLAEKQPAVNDLATDGERAFYAVHGLGSSDGAVSVVDPGQTATVLAPGLVRPQALAVFGEWIYVIDGEGPHDEGRVLRVAKSGGAEVLTAGLLNPVAIAVASHGVYVVNLTNSGDFGGILRVGLTGGAPTPVWNGLYARRTLAVNEGALYFATRLATNALFVLPVGAAEETPIRQTSLQIAGLALDGLELWWIERNFPGDPDYGEIWWDDGNGPIAVTTGDFRPHAIAFTDDAVFFSHFEGGTGGIRRICKPRR